MSTSCLLYLIIYHFLAEEVQEEVFVEHYDEETTEKPMEEGPTEVCRIYVAS